MCGRFTLRTDVQEIAELFQLDQVPELSPRYNIAPTQDVPAIRQRESDGGRQLDLLHWGLIPSWAKDRSVGNRMINARSETAATKPSFRSAMRSRRCLVVADGFYEWQKTHNGKQPYYIRRRDEKPFAFAGLWESWRGGEQPIQSCTILTTDANALMSPLHDRMPVILPAETYDAWLDPSNQDVERLSELLVPLAGDQLVASPVSRVVNSPRNELPSCIEPIA